MASSMDSAPITRLMAKPRNMKATGKEIRSLGKASYFEMDTDIMKAIFSITKLITVEFIFSAQAFLFPVRYIVLLGS